MSICVFGDINKLYTNMICRELHENKRDFYIISERYKKSRTNSISKIFNAKFNEPDIKQIPWYKLYRYKKITRSFFNRRQSRYKNLFPQMMNISNFNSNIFYVKKINSDETLKIIENRKFKLGIFGDVGIINLNIINKFSLGCINAHPAPLPDCRGGGAIQNTLLKNLPFSVSIHFVNEKIDGGDILSVSEIELEKYDNLDIVVAKLNLKSVSELVIVATNLIKKRDYKLIKNTGKLYLWKDCTYKKQKLADQIFISRIKELNN